MSYKTLLVLLAGMTTAVYLNIKQSQHIIGNVYVNEKEIEAIWYPKE